MTPRTLPRQLLMRLRVSLLMLVMQLPVSLLPLLQMLPVPLLRRPVPPRRLGRMRFRETEPGTRVTVPAEEWRCCARHPTEFFFPDEPVSQERQHLSLPRHSFNSDTAVVLGPRSARLRAPSIPPRPFGVTHQRGHLSLGQVGDMSIVLSQASFPRLHPSTPSSAQILPSHSISAPPPSIFGRDMKSQNMDLHAVGTRCGLGNGFDLLEYWAAFTSPCFWTWMMDNWDDADSQVDYIGNWGQAGRRSPGTEVPGWFGQGAGYSIARAFEALGMSLDVVSRREYLAANGCIFMSRAPWLFAVYVPSTTLPKDIPCGLLSTLIPASAARYSEFGGKTMMTTTETSPPHPLSGLGSRRFTADGVGIYGGA
ncbi:hypothetical protein C8F01DRAFT_1079461 [Mycena amicta]|nr:hypothetical protein C8F01DRAFT_1079461 [Mycena amicta]